MSVNIPATASHCRTASSRWSRLGNALLSCALVAALPVPAFAEKAAATDSYIDRFNPDHFMSFKPQTAYNVLENIPGANRLLVAINSASQSRGFGSAGDQILINNQRVSGKGNSVSQELRNIQAGDVDYIELIRGTTSELDVQSDGLVINVVLKKRVESSVLWSVGSVTAAGLDNKPTGSVVYSAGAGDLKYRIGLNHNLYPTHLIIRDQFSSPEQRLTDTYTRVRHNWYVEDQLTGRVEYPFSDSTALKLNALYEKVVVDATIATTHEDWLASAHNRSQIFYDWRRDNWELSGDISHELDTNNDLKLLFISNRLAADDYIWRESLPDNLPPEPDYRLPRRYTTTETVLRGNWKHRLDSRQTLDSGLELAINRHDEDLQFIGQSGAAYHSAERNDIEETRYEAFVNYNLAVSSGFNIQSSLIFERSTLEVATDFSLVTETDTRANSQSSRTFSYLKPRVNIRYDIDEVYQLRFNYERTVSQLNLDDFVPEFNRDETLLEETNPGLKPEVRDALSLSVEKQWLATTGSVTLTPYFHRISDLLTEVPLTTRSGIGNVDSGTEYGISMDTDFGLEAFGLANTRINAGYTWRDSRMTDPFTGQRVAIDSLSNNKWNVEVKQTALLPGLSLSLTLTDSGPYRITRFDYRGRHNTDMTANAYLDYQISEQLKLRLSGSHLLRRKTRYHRARHAGLFTENDVWRQEQRSYEREPKYSLTLTGQF